MSSVSVFCCLKGCMNGIGFPQPTSHAPKENLIQLDTSFTGNGSKIYENNICLHSPVTGYEIVIVKGGHRVCGAGAVLGNAPLVQSKSYFEVKIQQGGTWAIGLATRQTDLSLTQGKTHRVLCASLVWTLNECLNPFIQIDSL